MAEHTPKDWYTNPTEWDGVNNVSAIFSADGSYIGEVCVNEPTGYANACLITAAPKMLAALEMAVANIPLDDRQPETWKAIYDAIEKAKGK